MTAPVSTIPAFRAALRTAIEEEVDDPAVLVFYDEPTTANLPNDVISVGAVEVTTLPTQIVGSGGAGWLREEYVVTVICYAYNPDGAKPDAAEVAFARGSALYGAVVEAVRRDPSFDDLVVVAKPESALFDPAWDIKRAGRNCVVTVRIAVTAQL